MNALPEPDGGLSVEYERFLLQERKADGPLTAEDLAALVARPDLPHDDGAPIGRDTDVTRPRNESDMRTAHRGVGQKIAAHPLGGGRHDR